MRNTKLVKILERLVGYKTIQGNREEKDGCLDYLDKQLSFYPWIRKNYESDRNPSRVWITHDTLSPDVILYVHLDVVPASNELFKLENKNGKLIGRGVSDMKFAAAVYVVGLARLFREKQLPYSLGIMAVTDEENGGLNGAKYLLESIGYRAKVVLMPDGGDDWKMVKEAKGAAWVKLEIKGKSAHASKPWEGENAIAELASVVSYINSKYKVPLKEEWCTTVNLGKIEGGTTPNQVADYASVTLDVRSIPGRSVTEVILDLEAKFPKLLVQKIVSKSSFIVEPNDKYLRLWQMELKKIKQNDTPNLVWCKESGSGDHHYFSDFGSSVIVSKPDGGLIHTEEEWLSESGLYLYIDLFVSWLKKLDFSNR